MNSYLTWIYAQLNFNFCPWSAFECSSFCMFVKIEYTAVRWDLYCFLTLCIIPTETSLLYNRMKSRHFAAYFQTRDSGKLPGFSPSVAKNYFQIKPGGSPPRPPTTLFIRRCFMFFVASSSTNTLPFSHGSKERSLCSIQLESAFGSKYANMPNSKKWTIQRQHCFLLNGVDLPQTNLMGGLYTSEGM